MVVEVVLAVEEVVFVEGVLQGVAEALLEVVVSEVVASEAEEDHRTTMCNIISVLFSFRVVILRSIRQTRIKFECQF